MDDVVGLSLYPGKKMEPFYWDDLQNKYWGFFSLWGSYTSDKAQLIKDKREIRKGEVVRQRKKKKIERQKVKRERKVSDFSWHSCALYIEFEYIFQKRISPCICNSKLLANSTVSLGTSSASVDFSVLLFRCSAIVKLWRFIFFFPAVMWHKVYCGIP